MKICVYTIAKNEIVNAESWYNNVKDADNVYVLDGGSDDGTSELLQSLGCIVKIQHATPDIYKSGVFRFDVARNLALEMIPEDVDVCVAVDLDQRLNQGWRNAIEREWIATATHGRCVIHFTPEEDILYHHIHARKGAEWHGAVHEQVKFDRPEEHVLLTGVEYDHFPDNTKPRNYLNLTKLLVDEEPNSISARYFYARALFYAKKYKQSIIQFHELMTLDSTTNENIMNAWMHIAECYDNLGNIEGTYSAYRNAINTYPYLREPFCAYAEFCGRQNDFVSVYLYAKHALTINSKSSIYSNLTICYSYRPYDLVGIAAAKIGLHDEALFYEKKAFEIAPKNIQERLEGNIKKIEGFIKSQDV